MLNRPSAFLVLVCLAALIAGCNDDPPKVAPDRRDVNRLVSAVSDVVSRCLAVEAGYTNRVEAKVIERDVDFLVDAWGRLRPDSRFEIATGATTLREQSRIALRRLDRGCAPGQATRLQDAMDG